MVQRDFEQCSGAADPLKLTAIEERGQIKNIKKKTRKKSKKIVNNFAKKTVIKDLNVLRIEWKYYVKMIVEEEAKTCKFVPAIMGLKLLSRYLLHVLIN